ncbi:MAG TPA: VWA domain-containing protein [Nitrospirales bacterium]|nr:VWA domain-containing protein [Nitrospirales bacterium]
MLDQVTELHFLRPLWLLGLGAALFLYLLIRLRTSVDRQWHGIIEPHLLKHLKIHGDGGSRFQPLHLITLVVALGSLGMAGPAWEREQTPFTEDLAPLVIVLDLSSTMNAIDVPPTRLERVKQKIRDLLAQRKNARTGLLVYAGSAHSVLPLTNDPSILDLYVSDLRTDVMPVQGKNPALALQVAEGMLQRDTVAGTILFVTDGIALEHLPVFRTHQESTRDQVMVLAVGTREGAPVRIGDNRFLNDANGRRLIARLDYEGLEALSKQAAIEVISTTIDDKDVERIQDSVQSHLQAVLAKDEQVRWKDFGYFFTIPVGLLALFWFRKGWTVPWIPMFLLFLLPGCSANDGEFSFIDLWLTADQQGRFYLERQDYATAADRFDNPMWKGITYYQAGEYESAIDCFARLSTPEGYFNLGNAYAKIGDYPQAVQSYDMALKLRPDWSEALENKALVAGLIPASPEEPPGSDDPGGPTFDPDAIEFSEKGKEGQSGEVEMEQLSDEQIAEMWLRRLHTTPADFLRTKFALQAEQPGER